ncbi:MAG TPA: response regulator transcription factor [Candidatus Paceibacterota bacterium]|nr:response regulator transcription factor [Candidatus Paceibacterota bacterium]
MRILVVDDDPDVRHFLKEAFKGDSFVVDTAGDGSEGSHLARLNAYDAIVLDYVMPRKNGSQVLREIREEGISCPVLMLSVQSDVDDKVKLLELGADDYLSKPFSYRELLARVRALLRRPEAIVAPVLVEGDFVLDTGAQKAMRGSTQIYLTRKEFALVEFLMRHKGSVVSRGMLMEHVWSDGIDPFSNTVEAHIRNLRRKVDGPWAHKLIHTIPGRGYKIDAQFMVLS